LEYNMTIKNETLKKDFFSVNGRIITKVYANDTARKSDKGKDGKFVVIELSPNDENSATFIPNGKDSKIIKAAVTVTQLKSVEATDGNTINSWKTTMTLLRSGIDRDGVCKDRALRDLVAALKQRPPRQLQEWNKRAVNLPRI